MVNKKYQLHVTDTNGNVVQSVMLDEYPAEVRRIKEMGGFNMEAHDQFGNIMVVHYNVNHIVCIAIQEFAE
jgi:hypothetical protein